MPSRRRPATTALAVLAATGLLAAPQATVASTSLPPIHHVWIVVLENQSHAFDDVNFLSSIKKQGAYIPNYFAVGHESLDNYIALVSGQMPGPDTQADCQNYQNTGPGTTLGNFGQAPAEYGCVYPAGAKTIGDQLSAAGKTWKGYMEDMGTDSTRDGPVSCDKAASSTGASGTPDPTQSAQGPAASAQTNQKSPADQYAVRHNPFMYFHSIIDSPATCNAHVVELQDANKGLEHDLASVTSTPSYSFITPNLCDDGHDPSSTQSTTCAGPDATSGSNVGKGGTTSINNFLGKYVPEIVNSPAFRQDNGMLVIISDEAGGNPSPQTSNDSYSAWCCHEDTTTTQSNSNSQEPGIDGVGGGQVGALVLSPFVKPGTVSNLQEYNHYSLLRTVEDIFGTSGGSGDGHHLGWAATYTGGVNYAPCQQPTSSYDRTQPCQTDFGSDVFSDPTGQSYPDVSGQSGGSGQGPSGPTQPTTTGGSPTGGGSTTSGTTSRSDAGAFNAGTSVAAAATASPSGAQSPSASPSPDGSDALPASLTGPRLPSPGGSPFGLVLLILLPPILGIAGALVFLRRKGA